jgi:N utilization substance protein A
VDIRSETEFAAEEAEHGYEEEELQGRCAAILSNGRRCPNASLPGSRYCGLDTHQALSAIDSDRVADLAGPQDEGAQEAPEAEPRVVPSAEAERQAEAAPEQGPAVEAATEAAPEQGPAVQAATEAAPEQGPAVQAATEPAAEGQAS